MQARKSSNVQPTNRKNPSSRMGTQPNPVQSQPPSTNPTKQKQDSLLALVKQFLEKMGYPRTFQTLKNEKPARKPTSHNYNPTKSSTHSQDEEKVIINNFDKGQREELFKNTSKLFSPSAISNLTQTQAHSLRRLQFELHVYFCIYSIHPCTQGSSKKIGQVEKGAAEAFKKFIETKGSQISDEGELLVFFSLPYIPRPQENPTMARVFTKQWLQKLRKTLQGAIKEHILRNTSQAANKQNSKKNIYNCALQEMYEQHISNEKKAKCEEESEYLVQANSKYEDQIRDLRNHNKEMISYLDIMQQNLKDLNEASKANLVESNRKWFQFSKDILHLTKRALKGEKEVSEKLEKYQKFFGLNIDELIYSSADISIFEKNSYFTEDVSMFPADGPSRKGTNQPQMQQKAQSQQPQIAPIDANKISMLFNRANRGQLQKQICLVLKALKDRLYFHKNAILRREVIVQYQRNDICSIKSSNYHIQQKLLFEGGEKIKQFYLRLMNHISTDNLGNQYLSGSEKLIENLIGLMAETTEDSVYRKHVFGILQRLSFIKTSQMTMISFGVIPIIFKIFRNECEQLEYTSIQYLMGLIMNLAIKKQSIVNFEKHKSDIFPILLKFIDVDDNQIRGYVNGTFYVLLQLETIRRQALEKYNLKQIIQNLLDKSEEEMVSSSLQQPDEEDDDLDDENCNIVIRQYKYILERLEETGVANLDAAEEDEYDDDEDIEEDMEGDLDMGSENDESNTSEYIEGEETNIKGEELLMKKYALLGPEAVREEFLTRSILDDTSRKSHNMTTSINHSKRIDKVFHKNESVLGGKLDLSITPTR